MPHFCPTKTCSPLVAETSPGPVWGRVGGVSDVLNSLPFFFCPVLQIGGPRGEKGQKGEPAIIEPVRTISALFSFYLPRKKAQGVCSV